MRILVFSDTTGHMRGGVPAATRALLGGLVSRGHDVAFCSDIPLSQGGSVRFFEAEIFVPKRFAGQLSDAIQKFQPDVVHLISMSSKGLLETLPSLVGTTWVLTCHSIPPYERKIHYFHGIESVHYGARWLRFLANSLAWRYLFTRGRIPHVITHSDWVRRIAQGYGQSGPRTSVIALGYKPTETEAVRAPQSMPKDGPILLTVGGIAHTKGQHDAIGAVSRLRAQFPNIQYRIVGEIRDVSYLRWLNQLIERLDLRANVQIMESVTETEKKQLVDAADVYVQPSHEEGFCLAFLEAAFRVPRLVATNAGAMSSICGGRPGTRVVDIRAPAALASALASVLAEDVPGRTMEDRRRRLVEDFGWEGYVDAHEKLYQRLASASKHAVK